MAAKRFLGLDGLRGVCALSVLFFHCNDLFHKGAFFQHGYLAVDVFFILSGFVIALTYEQRLRARGQERHFLTKRAQKLFPTYWVGASFNVCILIAMAATGVVAQQDSWWMIWLFIPLTTLMLLPDYITPDGVLYPAMNSVAWSLFTEWLAYLGYAFSACRWRTSALVAVAACGWVLMTVAGYYTNVGWCVGATRNTLLTLGVLRCVSGFAAGVVIYRIHRHPLFGRLPVISTEVLLALWLGIAAVPAFTPTPTFDAIAVVILCPMLVCLLIRSEHKAPAYCKQLGALSYPLYVVHPGIILAATYTPIFGLSHGPRPLNAILVVALCLALAWLVMEIVARLPAGAKSGRGNQAAGSSRPVSIASPTELSGGSMPIGYQAAD
ncbi:MAG: acyltransferase family protein [Rhizomicrobium sp.]